MSRTCPRCGSVLSERANGPCPRCGAPATAHPASTVPLPQQAMATIASSHSSGGSLAAGKKYALVVVNGEEPGKIIPIDKPRVIIGRTDCDLVLSDPQLSRQHVLIAIDGLHARLEDLGSTNGTFVDGERVEHAELRDRSEFRIGSHELVFVMTDRDEA